MNVKTVFELPVEPRAQVGRTGSRRLRKAGKVPAVVYGGGEQPESMVLDHNALSRQMSREAFFTSILTLKIGAKSQQVVVKDVQRHPVKPLIMHMDFQRIREDEEITLSVPIHFLNEVNAKGVKDQGGVVDHLLSEVEVECLPRYLPEYLEIDVTALELNQIYHLSDIKLPEGVSLVALKHGHDEPVVAVNPPRQEEVDVVVEAAEVPAGEVPATAQAAPEAAAEGDDKEGKDKDAKKADKKEKG
ncbi:MAG TPA: 50S ribosomal protein L25/general stress protein Ctc [Gammaproteobacteria bacterium]|nr:50S ribosomal protein L25/general stress protein Ctc [Gammaproteobacteria bacterium]